MSTAQNILMARNLLRREGTPVELFTYAIPPDEYKDLLHSIGDFAGIPTPNPNPGTLKVFGMKVISSPSAPPGGVLIATALAEHIGPDGYLHIDPPPGPDPQ